MNYGRNQQLPLCIPGFERVQRYWDPTKNTCVAKLNPGDFYVTIHDEAISTVLGSCIAACIRDVGLNIGGMNHFMLPLKGSIHDKNSLVADALRYGNWAMEYLINEILKAGGRRRNLEVKIFGGSNVVEGLTSGIGVKNISFALDYLFDENLPVKAKDVGGNEARNVIYYPKTGKAQVKYVKDLKAAGITKQESDYFQSINKTQIDGDIELF